MKILICFCITAILILIIGSNEGFFLYANDGGLEAMSIVGMSGFGFAILAVNAFFITIIVKLIQVYRNL